MDVWIKTEPKDVLPFVGTVQRRADEDKNALGFLPAQVYEDAAGEGNLFVAVTGKDSQTYCGHLLIGGTFPHLRVFQVYVPSTSRKSGVGRALVSAAVTMAEEKGYISVLARVADDLEANRFWDRLEFPVARTQSGGESKKRILNVRVRELNTRTLFGYPHGAPVSRLAFGAAAPMGPAVYSVDLNVFFDVAKRRPRHEDAGRVFAAGLKGLVRIVVSEEFLNELRRNSKPNALDPVLEFAVQLPVIPLPPPEAVNALLTRIAQIVFPGRAAHLSTQDRSDLIHIATAIHHGLSGFITAENALVDAAPKLREKYKIEIVDVSGFAALIRSAENKPVSILARVGENSLQVCEAVLSNEPALRRLITRSDLSNTGDVVVGELGRKPTTKKSLVAILGDDPLALLVWDNYQSIRRVFHAQLFGDEDHPFLENALDALLHRFAREATLGGAAALQIAVPRGQVRTVGIARACGYSVRADAGATGAFQMERISVGAPVLPERWPQLREMIRRCSGNTFAASLPLFQLHTARFQFQDFEGEKIVNLDDLETSLSPVLLVLAGRTAVIVPIRPEYADQLLGTGKQTTFLPTHGASLFHKRIYYCDARNAKLLVAGTPIVFYESAGSGRGRSAAVALARTLHSYVIPKEHVTSEQIEHGVLDSKDVQKLSSRDKVAVITFDNVIPIQNPISVRKLRKMGCAGGANLISATRVDAEQFSAIVQEGFSNGV